MSRHKVGRKDASTGLKYKLDFPKVSNKVSNKMKNLEWIMTVSGFIWDTIKQMSFEGRILVRPRS